jgi:DNA polymerase iota
MHRVNSLQGFGYAIAKTVQNALRERAIPDLDYHKLTCQMIRDNLDEKAVASLFGAKLGSRLWSILHGNDEEPVNPSPEYPLQISVEDSHYGITSFTEAVAAMHKLCLHLLQRLKEDLTEDMNGDALASTKTVGPAGIERKVTYWARYPTSLRLSIRQGYDGFSRQSISTTFPVDALDEDVSAEERSRTLTQNLLTSLLKKLLGAQGTSGQCRITMSV